MKKQHIVLIGAASVAGAAVAFCASDANASVIEAIYTKIPGHPTSEVPGFLDLNGDPMFTEVRQFDQLTVSRTGKWFLRVRTQQVSNPDMQNTIMIGAGDSGTVVMQRGLPFPGAVGNEVFDSAGGGAGFNDNDDFAFRLRATGESTANFQKIMKSIGGVMSVAFEGGNPPGGDDYTGLEGPAGTPQTGKAGNSIGSAHLLNNGVIGTHDGGVHMGTTLYRPVLAYDLVKFQQRNVDTVVGYGGVGVELWSGMSGDSFWTTPDGSRWVAIGTIDQPSASNGVLVVDGGVVLRQTFPVPGSSVNVNLINNVHLLSNGDYYARGTQPAATPGAWASLNGQLLAATGDEIGNSGEHWAGTSFSAATGNNNGDWAIAGFTDNADPAADAVIVVNGEVVVREGDPVQVNGVDAFIGRANNTLSPWSADNVYLTDDKVLYFLASIHDGQGNDHNTVPAFSTPLAFMRIDLAAQPCPGDLDGNGVVNVFDLLELLACWGPTQPGCEDADLDNNSVINVFDLLELLAAWGPC